MFGFGPSFNPEKDIPDQSGKVILITGGTKKLPLNSIPYLTHANTIYLLTGNSGLGAESVKQFAAHNPSEIYLAARTASTAESTIKAVKTLYPNATITFLPLDLSSLESVKKAADTFNASSKRLDILLNNAGIMATPAGLTKEGYEIQFGTNHVGHALLTKLLLPTLERTAAKPNSDVRIINLSSSGERAAPRGGLVLEDAKTPMDSYLTMTRYGQSKLANILFTKELAKRYPSIKSVAVHPGLVNTDLGRGLKANWPILTLPVNILAPLVGASVATGSLNQLWAATSKDAKTGAFYYPVAKETAGSSYAQDGKLAERLWEWTEEELKKHGY